MISGYSTSALATLLERVADLLLTLDGDGTIRTVAVNNRELPVSLEEAWAGRKLVDTVQNPDLSFLEASFADALAGSPQRLELLHLDGDGLQEIPIQYQLVSDGNGGLIAAGTDLRPTAGLRQQLLNAQQALEQDYWRLRQVETRYRRMFDMVGDALLVVDALSYRVLEANPRANELLGDGDKGVIGKVFPRGLDQGANKSMQDLLTAIRSVGRGQLPNLLLADGQTRVEASASFLRQAGEERFLLRLAPHLQSAGAGGEAGGIYLQEVLRAAPDAIVLVDEDGRIVAVNHSFLELAQLVSEEQVLGHSADRWLGRSGVDLNVLLSNLREKSVVKLFSSTLVPDAGSPAQIEISACRLEEPDGPAFALFIRDVERRVARDHPVAAKLPRSIEQVTQRVGRVPLKELVRESTDLIEALCIETALEVTRDNRASAAELLGLSRQSLYAKLRRFNIGGQDASDD